MSDNISRADAIEAVCRTRCGDKAKGCPAHSCLVIEEFDALPSAETHEIRTETHGVCLISKDDAIEAVLELNTDGRVSWKDAVIDMLDELPSAEAKPTVIRSKTLLPTKDFKEWAKRVRDGNPNVIVIPCDAEVVSADAVHGEWEFVDNEIFAGEYFCSVCGKRAEVDLYGEWILSNFCPSCGARMVREDGE